MATYKECLFVLFATVATGLLFAESAQQKNADMTYADKLRGIYDLVKPMVRVEGQVVDEKGQPVEGAEVVLSWEHATLLIGKTDYARKALAHTDDSGWWRLELEKPLSAYIRIIKKEGYEYSGENNSKTYSRDLVYEPLPNGVPFVSVLRKRGEPTFLLLSKSRHGAEEPLFQVDDGKDACAPVDILAWMGKVGGSAQYVDLMASASFNDDTRNWHLTFSVSNNVDGLFVCDRLLYEAPATGYVQNASMPLAAREGKAYLYLRSRDPTIFSRISLTYWHAVAPKTGRGRIRVSYDVCVNPYGERNLEYDERADSLFGLADRLTAEAKSALSSGRHAEKPDMDKRLSERREQLENDKEADKKKYERLKVIRDANDQRHREWVEQQKKQKEGKAE